MLGLQIVFACFILLIFHTYVGFPCILKVLSRKKQNVFSEKANIEAVTIIIPLYNEEKVIAEKLDSILESNYPKDKLFLLIASDNSTDKTNEIVQQYVEKYKKLGDSTGFFFKKTIYKVKKNG